MSATYFESNIQYKPKYVEPAGGSYDARDSGHEAMIARLDGERPDADDSTHVDAGEVLRMFLEWITTYRASDPRAINYIGKPAIAAAWVMSPERFGNVAGHIVAESFGMPKTKFSEITSEFAREFKIRNSFQAHDGKHKPAPHNKTKHISNYVR
jgi:hypothetical protein